MSNDLFENEEDREENEELAYMEDGDFANLPSNMLAPQSIEEIYNDFIRGKTENISWQIEPYFTNSEFDIYKKYKPKDVEIYNRALIYEFLYSYFKENNEIYKEANSRYYW